MGVADRDWARSTQRPHRIITHNPFVVKWLIILNIAVFALDFFRRDPSGESGTLIRGAYIHYSVFSEHEYWRLLSYQFLHANIQHILFNMIALWFFGNLVESVFGSMRFLVYYLVCGISAALFYSLLCYMGLCYGNISESAWQFIPMVGASGSIYGVMAAAAIMFPHARVQLLFPPVELSMRTLALCVLGLAMVYIVFNWSNAGGEAGHMGGMITGFIITYVMLKLGKISAF